MCVLVLSQYLIKKNNELCRVNRYNKHSSTLKPIFKFADVFIIMRFVQTVVISATIMHTYQSSEIVL